MLKGSSFRPSWQHLRCIVAALLILVGIGQAPAVARDERARPATVLNVTAHPKKPAAKPRAKHTKKAKHPTKSKRKATPTLKRTPSPTRKTFAQAAVAIPLPPFHECPPVGADTSCGLLIDVTSGGNVLYGDSSQGPYDSVEDTLIGVRNDASSPVSSLSLASNTDLFGFDGDGLCTYGVAGCPFGPTGYEGPGTSFSSISASANGGLVKFSPAIPPGGTAYFSLEESLQAAVVYSGGPTSHQQGAAPNSSIKSTTCQSAHPVNCATGTFWHTFTDATIPGHGVALDFSRTYSAASAAITGPLGYGWTDSYAMSLTVNTTGGITVAQENGSTVDFSSYNGGYVAAPWILASLVKNPDGGYTFTRNSSNVDYRFNAAGQLIAETDRNGYSTTLSYDAAGNLTTVTDPSGRSLTLAYTGGRLSQMTDPVGHKTAYAYDAGGNLASSTDPLGRTWHYTYDPSHRLLTMVDPRDNATTNTYDTSDRVIKQVDPAGHVTTWSYTGDPASSSGGTTVITDPHGVQTKEEYSSLELTSLTRAYGTPDASTTSYEYDPATLGQTKIIEANGATTTNGYDGRGNLTSSRDALGRTSQFSYDAHDDVLTATDPLGTTTTNTYDAAGNLLTQETPLTGTGDIAKTSYTYGSGPQAGDVLTATDPARRTTTFGYDAAGDQTSVANPSGDTTTASYDGIGHALRITTPRGGASTRSYDAAGQLVKVVDPLGKATTYGYDGNGNRASVTNANGHKTTYTYDADDQRTRVTRPDGTTQTSAYDARGNLLTQTDGAGHDTTNTYDDLNRVSSTSDPLGRKTTYGYDSVGNLVSKVDPAGRTTGYVPDAAHQLTKITYSDGTTDNVTEGYDADGRRTSMTDGTGTSSDTYDSLGRLTKQTNGAGRSTTYAYDLAGDVVSQTYPNGKTVTRAYDANGRLKTIQDWLGNTSAFGYDADGDLTSGDLPGSVSQAGSYDRADRLIGIADTRAGQKLAAFSYTRDALGQLTSDVTTGAVKDAGVYFYDSSERLKRDVGSTYAYDDADNATKYVGGQSQTFDAASQLASTRGGSGDLIGLINGLAKRTKPRTAAHKAIGSLKSILSGIGGPRTYTYNAEGDRIGVTGLGVSQSLKYDQANRLSSVAGASYGYDGDGLRSSKTVNGATRHFAWDESGGLPLLLEDGSTSYVYGPNGEPIEQIAAGVATFLLHDQQNSTRLLTNAAGTVVGTYTYDSWGSPWRHTGNATSNLQYNGEYTDAETGFQYLRERYYDPATGQFLTLDPMRAITRSPFNYAANSPTNDVDPMGLGFCALGHNPNGGCRGGSEAVATTQVIHVVTGAVATGAAACSLVAAASIIGNAGVSEACGVVALASGGISLAASDVLYATGNESTGGLILDIVGTVPIDKPIVQGGQIVLGVVGTAQSIHDLANHEGEGQGGSFSGTPCALPTSVRQGFAGAGGYLQPAGVTLQ